MRRASAAQGASRLQSASIRGTLRRSARSTRRAKSSTLRQAGFSARTGMPASRMGARTAGAWAPVSVTTAMAGKQEQTTDRLRVAIAGCHRMVTRQPGSHNWAAAFAAVAETKVVAVFDAGAETRTAFVECWSGEGGGDGEHRGDGTVAAYD